MDPEFQRHVDAAAEVAATGRMRIENLDWESRVIFVPDSKTEEGRRRVRMSNRVFDVLKQRCEGRREGWVSHLGAPSRLTSPQWRRDFEVSRKIMVRKLRKSLLANQTS